MPYLLIFQIENCEPLCIQNIQFHEPVMDMCQYGNVIYASCGDSVFKLSLQRNTTKLNRNFISYPCFEVVKMKMSHKYLKTFLCFSLYDLKLLISFL